MSRPYVVKLGYWAWGCWDCPDDMRCGFTWRQATALALWHRWRHEQGLT